jgi:fatty acid desaturase
MGKYTFWLWTAAIVQIVSAGIHSLNFFRKPSPQNETERQLFDLMYNYKPDMGAGFHPSMADFFTGLSSCFTMLYLFAGLSNIYIIRKNLSPEIVKGFTSINLLIFGAAFLIMLVFTFLPPIILAGLVFLTLCFAYATNHIHVMSLKKD